MSLNILELKEISKSFTIRNTQKQFTALNNINLNVRKGEWIGIVGESGSGKSTLARIIMQIESQDQGHIEFLGKNLETPNKTDLKWFYRNCQMVFQSPSSTFSKRMKIGTYLIEPFINYKIKNKDDALIEAKHLLDKVNLPESYIHKYPHELSGGELQRVVIARVIGIKPAMIIFDEATSALDVATQRELLNLLLKLKNETDFSAIFISHNIALVKQITDRIVVLYKGEFVDEFKSDDLLKKERNVYTKLLVKSVFDMR